MSFRRCTTTFQHRAWQYCLSVCCSVFLLGGCAQLNLQPETPLPPGDSWLAQQQRQQTLSHWQLSGKIGIRAPQENQSANLQWQQAADQYRIELSGPLGQGGAHIQGDSRGIQVDIAGEETLYAESAEQLMDNSLGWHFPISELLFWIKGIPAPDTPYRLQIEQNRLRTLEQNGWQINYLRYIQQGEYSLPSKLTILRDQLRITIVTKEWQLTP